MKYKYDRNRLYKLNANRIQKKKRNADSLNLGRKFGALLMLAFASVIWYYNDLSAVLQSEVKRLERELDLKVKDINVEGAEKIPIDEIIVRSGINLNDSIHAIDLLAVKGRLEQNPWVEKARVIRTIPSSITISITEERPVAIYIKKGSSYLINSKGKLLEKVESEQEKSYIYVIGEGANLVYFRLLKDLTDFQPVIQQLEGLVLVGNRRWDLKMKGNVTVNLPEGDYNKALAALVKINEKQDIFKYSNVVDLRFIPDKIYIK
jgi:cell division protein FtsQ